jgi:alkyl hydroperoxide reductase subunit D
MTLESLRQKLGDPTKDLKLNISSVLSSGALDETQRYTVAICSAIFLKDDQLTRVLVAEAGERVTKNQLADAKSAAAIMAMNTVFYRFRHMVGKESYQQIRAGLRMQCIAKPLSSKATFELCSLACAALAGCEMCIQSHEASLIKEGLREDQINDVVRIAAVVSGFQTALFAEATLPDSA